MCGLAAVFKRYDVDCPFGAVLRMRDEARHRGPDDEGAVFFTGRGTPLTPLPPSDNGWTAGLGHRRLSILDLTVAGHQPMSYRDRYWLVHNGEIYNYVELRAELARLGHTFRSTSDTEVILAAFAEWGPACFARLRGMWALILFDARAGEVFLCRDRLGIKPLYLWQADGLAAVASEVKQFHRLPAYRARVDPMTTAEYLRSGHEDPDRTFFAGVTPIPAGSWTRMSLATLRLSPFETYWHPERIQPVIGDGREAASLFAAKLEESVRLHLRSDVPVGCALSGGLDSSAITVLAGRAMNGHGGSLQTFSCTFPGERFDERRFVEAVLSRQQAVSHFVTPEPDGFLRDLDRFVWTHDEPVGSVSMYAGYCLAKRTRAEGISVALNGQGGDEILLGYWQSYFLFLRSLVIGGHVVGAALHFLGALTASGNPHLLRQLPTMLRRYRFQGGRQFRFQRAVPEVGVRVGEKALQLDSQAQRLYQLRTLFLPRLLKWEDRNSMAFSVEGRYPFLDHELIELCLAFRPEVLFRRGWTKWPLRVGLADLLPQSVRDRRSKLGFEVPQYRWLCGPLRAPLERWLAEDRPLWALVDRADVRQIADRTWSGKEPREELGQLLFRLFMFDQWMVRFDAA